MSEPRNFSRRRRGGMRFRPSGGLNQKPDRGAQQARAEATGDKKPETIFERGRHDDEINRAENIAAGLPPGEPHPEDKEQGHEHEHGREQQGERPQEQQQRPGGREGNRGRRGSFRKPNLETPAEVQEEKFEPVAVQAPQQGLVSASKMPPTKSLRKSSASSSRKKKSTRKSSSTRSRSKRASPFRKTEGSRNSRLSGRRKSGSWAAFSRAKCAIWRTA